MSYERQLCTQKALAMAVRTVTMKLMIFLMVSLRIMDYVKCLMFTCLTRADEEGQDEQMTVQRELIDN